MPITAEVGAIFLIEDRASQAIDRIASSLERLSSLATKTAEALTRIGVGVRGLTNLATRLDQVESSLSRLGVTADRSAGSIDSAMIRVEDAAVAATDAVAGLNRELAMSGSAARMGGSSSGGAIAGAEGFGAGAIGRRMFGMPALAGGFTMYEAGKAALTEDQALHKMLMMMQMPDSPQNMSQLRGIMQQSAKGTIYSEQQTAMAGTAAAELLGYTGPGAMTEFQKIFPIALRGAEVGTQFGLGSVESNMDAMIRMAHLQRQYDPTKLEPSLDQFLNIAERTHTPFAALERTMALGVPMAVAAGADPDTAANAIGYLSRAGLGGRAGSSFGQMLVGLLPTGGPITAHMGRAQAGLMATMKSLGIEGLHPGESRGRKGDTRHNQALHDLGLLGPDGESTVFGADGKLDLSKFLNILGRDASSMKPEAFEAATHAAFETRGMRGSALIDQGLFSTWSKTIAGAPGALEQQNQLAQTPLQLLEQVWARLKDIGNTLMTSIVGPMDQLVTSLLRLLNTFDAFLKNHPDVARILASGAVGAAAGGIVGGVPGAVIGGAAGATAGAFGGVERGTGGRGVHPPTSPTIPMWHITPRPGSVGGRGVQPGSPLDGPIPQDQMPVLPGGPIPQAYHPGSGGGVIIQNLNINGAPNDSDGAWTKKIMKNMADALHREGTRNQDRGWGWEQSPYTQGVDI